MAVQTPPFVLQNSSHGSELVRREALASLTFGSGGGVVPATPTGSPNSNAGVASCSDLKVNAPASGMSCLLNPGQIYVPGTLGSGSGYGIGTGYTFPVVTLNGGAQPTVAGNAHANTVQLTTQGVYYCYNDNSGGQVSLTVAASNASNPRIDVVIAQVEDASYSGANNDWKLAVVTGTAAASPTVPALPANSLPLAYLWIPAASTNVTAGNILDLRVACNRNPFRAKMHQANAQSPATGTDSVVVAFDTVDYDLAAMCTTGASAGITTAVSGLWVISGQCVLTTTGSNTVFSTIVGTTTIRHDTQRNTYAAGVVGLAYSAAVVLTQSNLTQLGVFTGASATTSTGAQETCFEMALISPL